MGQWLNGTGGDGLQELQGAEPLLAKKALGQEKSCQVYTELLYLGHAGEMMMLQNPTGLTQGLDSPWGWEADPYVCSLLQLPLCFPLSPQLGTGICYETKFPRQFFVGKVIWLSYLKIDALKAFLNLLIKYDALQHYQRKCWQAGFLLEHLFSSNCGPRGSGSRGRVGLAPVQNQDPI